MPNAIWKGNQSNQKKVRVNENSLCFDGAGSIVDEDVCGVAGVRQGPAVWVEF